MTEHVGSSTLEKIRRFEVERVRPWVNSSMNVLEIGGADGLQASVIASWGCSVHSIDVADRPHYEKTFYKVDAYDGAHLPFADASLDLIFSSNVLEHIRNVPSMLAECRRVLKKDGRCIHILPSSSWRFWTMLTHYPDLVLRLVRMILGKPAAGEGMGTTGTPVPSRRFIDKVKNALLPPPHGEYATSFTEIYTYSTFRWKRVFREYGFAVEKVTSAGLFYTGHDLLPFLPLSFRQAFACLGGAASLIYVLRKTEARP